MARRAIPQSFYYRGMMCECINLHAHNGPPKTMTIKINPTRDTDVLDLLEKVPNDPLFQFLIAYNYHLVIIGKIMPMMQYDEIHKFFVITMTFKTAFDQPFYHLHCEEIPIFDNNMIPPEYCDTFVRVHEDVHAEEDSEVSCNIMTQVTVSTTRIHGNCEPYSVGALSPWGVQIDLNVNNLDEVILKLKNYRPGKHDDLIADDLYQGLKTAIRHISDAIDPEHVISLGYDYYVVSSYANDSIRGLTYFIAVYPSVFNGIEVRLINHQKIIFRPEDDDLIKNHPENIDWRQVYQRAEDLITALYSVDGSIIIPHANDHSIIYEYGEPYFEVRYVIDAAPFTAPYLTFPSNDAITAYQHSDISWIPVELMDELDYITDKIQLLIPLSGVRPMYDKRALFYARIARNSFDNKESTVPCFMEKFNSEEFRIDIIAESDAWITLRVSSSEDIPVYDDTDPTNQTFGNQFLPPVSFENKPHPCNDGVEFIIGTLFTSDMLTAYINQIPDHRAKYYIEQYHWTADRFGLFMYEIAADVQSKSWFPIYQRVINMIYDGTLDDNLIEHYDDNQSDNIQIDTEEKENRSLISKIFGDHQK